MKILPIILCVVFQTTVLLLCISLLQWHSMQFWVAAIGVTGFAWSIALELISLWLWFAPCRKFFRPLAWATTFLLLTGPLYQVSNPLIQNALLKESLSVAISQERTILKKSIAEKQEELATFLTIAKSRVGWQIKIDQTQATLEKNRSRLLEIISNNSGTNGNIPRLTWQRRVIITMQLLSILIFQAAIILSITTLSFSFHYGRKFPGNVSEIRETRLNPQVIQLLTVLRRKIQQQRETGKSQADIARDHNISPRYITHILNFEQYEAQPLSLNQLKRLADIFGISTE